MIPTIFASATPAGKSAISVLRIAGPQSFSILKQLAPQVRFRPRQAKVSRIFNNEKNILDEALVLTFQKPHSFTGEDIVELYLHGSPAVSRAVQQAIVATNMARPAEPGEFVKRAFHNNRLDLTEVEGIRDLLAAETEMQRQAAISGASGHFSRKFEGWRSNLVESSALLMANIDFAEDNGLAEDGTDDMRKVRAKISQVRADIDLAVSTSAHCSELVKEGIRVALLGEPNSGKSSLTNRLVQRSVCLVSDIPGTTRDVIEVALELGGHKFVLVDTAGLRGSSDTVEQLGMDKAREVIQDAHIVVSLFPVDCEPNPEIIAEIDKLKKQGKPVLQISSKSDLLSAGLAARSDKSTLFLSALTGVGIDEFAQTLSNHANRILNSGSNISKADAGLSLRSRGLLCTEALPGLTDCLKLLDRDVVLANAELQRAVQAIGNITGKDISAHEVLDIVFGEFCIGK